MKKIIFFALTLTLGVFSQTVAQSVAVQNLNNAIQSTENVQQEVSIARKAVNQLAKELAILGNPNAILFADKMNSHVNSVLNNSDDMQYFMDLAQNNSTISFSTTPISSNAGELVNQNDIIMDLNQQMTAAIEANLTEEALSLIKPIRSALAKQYSLAADSITYIESIITLIETSYTVCIKTVDYQGNSATYAAGFYAQNTDTNAYIYPGSSNDQDYGQGNCFYNLVSGTYTFGSYQDYFCGTNSSTITLSQELVNADGIIEVTLVVWCE